MALNLANEIIYNRQKNVERLVEAGADVNEVDDYGYTPLIESAIANSYAIADLLLKHGAKVNERDVTGGSALHWASENHHMPLCKLLLDNGADPNAYTKYGQPVLVKPLLRNQQDLKELLYRHGADLKFAQDYINTKLIGHRFELRGRVDIVDNNGKFIEIDLEGFVLEFTISIIQDSLIHFKNNFTAKNLRPYFDYFQEIIDAFSVAAELLRYQQYMVDISHHKKRIETLINRDLLLIPIGCQGHAITFIKLGNLFAKCDRGENSLRHPTVSIYKVGRKRGLNSDFIKQLLYTKQSREFINEGIIEYLALEPVVELPLSPQITGNCSWANVEGAVATMLFLLLLKDQAVAPINDIEQHKSTILSIYKQWQEWDKDWALHQCIESFYDANQARKAAKVALLAAVLFQCCDFRGDQDIRRATKILAVLKHPDYEYILKAYLSTFDRTEAGNNLKQLIDICQQ